MLTYLPNLIEIAGLICLQQTLPGLFRIFHWNAAQVEFARILALKCRVILLLTILTLAPAFLTRVRALLAYVSVLAMSNARLQYDTDGLPIFSAVVAIRSRLARALASEMVGGLTDTASSGVSSSIGFTVDGAITTSSSVISITSKIAIVKAFNRTVEAVSGMEI